MRMKRTFCDRRLAGIVIGFLFVNGCATAKDSIQLTYTLRPDHAGLLADGSTVSVGDIGVTWDAYSQDKGDAQRRLLWNWMLAHGSEGITRGQLEVSNLPAQQSGQSGRMWENAARSQIGALISERARVNGKAVATVDRDHLTTLLRERDLQLADIAVGSGKMGVLGIDAFIVGSVNASTNIIVTEKSRLWMMFLRWLPYVGPIFWYEGNRPKQEVQRTLTFAGHFKLIDGRNGREWLVHDFSEQTLEKEKSRPFTGDRTIGDLDSEDAVVKKLLEREVKLFVGRMFAVPLEATEYVESSGHKASVCGVSSLKSDPRSALTSLEAAAKADPRDHKSRFAAGVAAELLRMFEVARDWYASAMAIEREPEDEFDNDDDDYRVYKRAMERASLRMERGEVVGPGSGVSASDAGVP